MFSGLNSGPIKALNAYLDNIGAKHEARGTTGTLRKMLSKNFALAEFIKPEEATTFQNAYNRPLLEHRLTQVAMALQQVRDELEMPLIVTSGWRSKARNKAVGGSPTSDHPLGYCADVMCPFINAAKLAACFVSAQKRGLIAYDQLIIYDKHVHVSVNPRRRGQVFTK